MSAAKAGGRRYKVAITLWDQYVSPRLDLASEVLIATIADGRVENTRTVIPAAASADENCRLILSEQADIVVTGGIQRRYHEYLTWKKVEVLDSVMGPWEKALQKVARGELQSEAVLYDEEEF